MYHSARLAFDVVALPDGSRNEAAATFRYRLASCLGGRTGPVKVGSEWSDLSSVGAQVTNAAAQNTKPAEKPKQPSQSTSNDVPVLRFTSVSELCKVDLDFVREFVNDPYLHVFVATAVGGGQTAEESKASGKGTKKSPPSASAPKPMDAVAAETHSYRAWIPLDCSPLLANQSSVFWSSGDSTAAAAALSRTSSLPPPADATDSALTSKDGHGLAALEEALHLPPGSLISGRPLPQAPSGFKFLHVAVRVIEACRPAQPSDFAAAGAQAPPSAPPAAAKGKADASKKPPPSASAGSSSKKGAAAEPPAPTIIAVVPPLLMSGDLLAWACPLRLTLRHASGLPDWSSIWSGSVAAPARLRQPYAVIRRSNLQGAAAANICAAGGDFLSDADLAALAQLHSLGSDLVVTPLTSVGPDGRLVWDSNTVVCLGDLSSSHPSINLAAVKEALATRSLQVELHDRDVRSVEDLGHPASSSDSSSADSGSEEGEGLSHPSGWAWPTLPAKRLHHYERMAAGAVPCPLSPPIPSAAPEAAIPSGSRPLSSAAAAAASSTGKPASTAKAGKASEAAASADAAAASNLLQERVDRLFVTEALARVAAARQRHAHAQAMFRLDQLLLVLPAKASSKPLTTSASLAANLRSSLVACNPASQSLKEEEERHDLLNEAERLVLRTTPEYRQAEVKIGVELIGQHWLPSAVTTASATGTLACAADAPSSIPQQTPAVADTGGKQDAAASSSDPMPGSSAPTGFSRVIVSMPYDDDVSLRALLAAVTGVNQRATASVPGSDGYMRAISLTPEQVAAANSGALPIVSGFQLIEPNTRTFVLEGGAVSVSEVLASSGAAESCAVRNSSGTTFSSRLWISFGLHPREIRLCSSLHSIVINPATSNRALLPEATYAAVQKLYDLLAAPSISTAQRLGLFPSPEELSAVQKRYGETVSLLDIFGAGSASAYEVQDAAAALSAVNAAVQSHCGAASDVTKLLASSLTPRAGDADSAQVLASSTTGRRRRRALSQGYVRDMQRNESYEAHRRSSILRNFQRENSSWVRQQSITNASVRTQSMVVDAVTGEVVPLPRAADGSSTEQLLDALRYDSKATYSFAPAYNSQSVDAPFSESEGKVAASVLTRAQVKQRWRTQQGFVYPAKHSLKEDSAHPKAPLPAVEMGPGGEPSEPEVDRVLLQREADFTTVPRPRPFPQGLFGSVDPHTFLPVPHSQAFRSVHSLPAAVAEADTKERTQRMKETWNKSVVVGVGNTTFRVRRASADLSAADRATSLLRGDACKLGLVHSSSIYSVDEGNKEEAGVTTATASQQHAASSSGRRRSSVRLAPSAPLSIFSPGDGTTRPPTQVFASTQRHSGAGAGAAVSAGLGVFRRSLSTDRPLATGPSGEKEAALYMPSQSAARRVDAPVGAAATLPTHVVGINTDQPRPQPGYS